MEKVIEWLRVISPGKQSQTFRMDSFEWFLSEDMFIMYRAAQTAVTDASTIFKISQEL